MPEARDRRLTEPELVALWRQATLAAGRHEEDAEISARRAGAARDEANRLLIQLKNFPPIKAGGPRDYEGRLREVAP